MLGRLMRSSATEPHRDRWRLILLGHLAVTGVENRVGPVPAASPAPGHATVRLTLSGTGLRRSRPRRHFANVRRCLSPPAVDLMTYSRRRWLATAWWLSTGTKRLRSVQSPAAGNTGRRCARRCGRIWKAPHEAGLSLARQSVLEDLPGRIVRQLVDESHLSWNLVTGEFLAAVRDDAVLVQHAPPLSANMTETPASFGITVGRWR